MRHINFVNGATEHTASWRMRCDIPANLLRSKDYIVTIGAEPNPMADTNVFSKHWNMDADAEAIATAHGKKVFDVCDDHFDRKFATYYEYMCASADVVTCNTQSMQERIYDCTGRLAHIINDPITFPLSPFRYNKEPRYLWYGNAVNLESVYSWASKVPNLTIITNAKIDGLPSHIESILWQPDLVENTITDYDIVLLPRNPHEWAKTKSPNRATDALHAGRFVITDFPEVYGEFDSYVHIGPIEEGIEFYKKHPKEVDFMVYAGQRHVGEKYHDDVILTQWIKALDAEKEDE